MSVSLVRIRPAGDDRAELTTFLASNAFPFHTVSHPTPIRIAAAIDAGAWDGEATESFWIDDDARGRIGVVRIDELTDPTATVDLRLAERWRGLGLGAGALDAATAHVFRSRPGVQRLEGTTREDNVAMQRTFERCGWVRESYYRDGWPVEAAEPMASVGYSMLRRDHETGTTTPVPARVAHAPIEEERRVAIAWAAEERLLDPAVRRDPARVAELLGEDFVEIGQSGRRWTRAEIIEALAADPGDDAAPVIDERRSRPIGPNTVLLEYLLRFEGRVSRRSSLWRCDPRPRCLFHQGTPVS